MDVEVVLISALTIGVVHSFAPDHYVPFVAIGKSRKWSNGKILLFSLTGGMVHVLSSVTIGFLILLGLDVFGFASFFESFSSYALILIGLLYAFASLIYHHHHVKTSSAMLLIVLSLAPCIPLIPLMLVPEANASLVALIYSVSTIATILTLTYLTSKALKPPRIFHGKEEFFTGMVIAFTGIITHIFGLKNKNQISKLGKEFIGSCEITIHGYCN